MAGGGRLLTCLVLLAAAWQCRAEAGAHGGSAAAATRPPPPHKAHPKVKHAKLRRACDPDDARCVALREHTCDPYFTNVSDVCTFVQYNRHCAEDVHHIAYLPLFYCRHGDGRVVAALFFLAWMAVLFWVMSKAAEDFLVPALEHLAMLMRMAPDVAGVTLFAFASGAPDLFTQIAAVAVGGNVDQELAISATLGGGLFIIAVIFSVVVLVNRPAGAAAADGSCAAAANEIMDRRAFVRDCVAYLLSTLALLGVMLRGVFSAWEAGLLLLGYAAYLTTCILTSRGGGAHARHGYAAVSPTQQQQAQAGHTQLEVSQLGGGGQPNGVGQPNGGGVPPRSAQLELVPRTGGSLQPLPRKPPESGGKPLFQPGGGAGEADVELAALVAGVPASDAPPDGARTPPARAAWRGKLGASSSSRLGKALGCASLGLQEMLHTRGKSGPSMWLTMLMAPAMLLLHATMPALHPGYYTPWYALTLSLGAPMFMLLSTEMYPRHLTTDQLVLAWLLAALALLALLLLAVPPAGTSGGGQGGLQPGTPGGSAVSVVAMARGSPLAPTAPGSGSPPAPAPPGGGRWARASAALTGCSAARLRHLCGARRPRRNAVLAVLAAVQCMLWLSVAADELVSLFQAIGRICDISQDLLGATVLAWGEAVPELVATSSLARQGRATTAIAAVFGGPVFNILCAWAGPTLYSALRKKSRPYRMTGGVATLTLFTLLVLAFLLAAIPLAFRWRLARRAALAVLALYGVSQVLFLLVEEL